MHFGRKQDQTTGEYTLKCEEDVLVHKNYRELTLRHIWACNWWTTESLFLLHCEDVFAKTINWRGVWNKALSDFWCNVKFSSLFTTEFKEIWKENLVIYQKSLKAFLQAPLQLNCYMKCKDSAQSKIKVIVSKHVIWRDLLPFRHSVWLENYPFVRVNFMLRQGVMFYFSIITAPQLL